MDNNSQSQLKIEITHDKLVDILLHAATREDLATLAADTKLAFAKAETETKAEFAKTDAKIEKVDAKMNGLILLAITGIISPVILHFFFK